MSGVVALLATLHGDCMRLLCTKELGDHIGLTVAARSAKRWGRISPGAAKLMEKLDIAYHVADHISDARCGVILDRLRGELAGPRRAYWRSCGASAPRAPTMLEAPPPPANEQSAGYGLDQVDAVLQALDAREGVKPRTRPPPASVGVGLDQRAPHADVVADSSVEDQATVTIGVSKAKIQDKEGPLPVQQHVVGVAEVSVVTPPAQGALPVSGSSEQPAPEPKAPNKRKPKRRVVAGGDDDALLDAAILEVKNVEISAVDAMHVVRQCMFGHRVVASSARCPGKTGRCSSVDCQLLCDGVRTPATIACIGKRCPFEVCDVCIVQLATNLQESGNFTTKPSQPRDGST